MSLTANWLCYRLYTWDADRDLVDQMWRSVTVTGGWVTIRSDCIDFFVSRDHCTEFLLRWSEFVLRQSQLDHC
jgi:hypothetical protein